jgi:hypothetical protein
MRAGCAFASPRIKGLGLREETLLWAEGASPDDVYIQEPENVTLFVFAHVIKLRILR